MKKLKYWYITIFILLCNVVVFGQFEGEEDTELPPPPETEGKPATPIDMYEGALLLVAILLIVGYYFYTRSKRKVA